MKAPGLRLLAVVLSAQLASGQERAPIPAFPTQAEAITADVVVVDRDGRPVRGLQREDFTLLEDGKPQRIVAFEAREVATAATTSETPVAAERVATNEGGRGGRTFAFLIDDLGTRPLVMEDAKKAVKRWLREKALPQDDVTLVTVSGDLFWSDRIDRGREDLEVVLARARGKMLPERSREWISDWEAYRIANFEDLTGAGVEAAGPGPGPAGPPSSGGGAPTPDALGRIAERVMRRTGLGRREVQARAAEVYDRLGRRTRALLGATERLSRGLAGTRGRKSILVFSEGFLFDANRPELFDQAIDASQRANTAIYFVDVKGLAGQYLLGADRSGDAPDPRAQALISMEEGFLATSGTEHVAENTGGTSVRSTNDLFGGLARVAEESSTYYLLGYQPEKAPDGRWHKLEVKVARPGVKVRARHGYQATPPAPLALDEGAKRGRESRKGKDKAPKRALDPAVLTSGAADALPLRLAPYVLDADPKTGLVRVLVALEVDTGRLSLRTEGGRRRGQVDLAVVGVSRDDPRTFPRDERLRVDVDAKATAGWLTLDREVWLPPGVAQVRALARDVASGRAGAVAQRLEVPAFDAPYLATPILTDRLVAPKDATPRLVPVAHRSFRAQGHLFCSYEVYGMTNAAGQATTRVAGGFTLRDPAGEVVLQASPTPIAVALGGKVVRTVALPLTGLEAGDYELVVDVIDEATGRSLQAREAFRLEPGAS